MQLADTFQSTLSMRRATPCISRDYRTRVISIHALHEESDAQCICPCPVPRISIHALHEESDYSPHRHCSGLPYISIHALHEESDAATPRRKVPSVFQSTLSMRRATHTLQHSIDTGSISIHALHEESDITPRDVHVEDGISIHALHEESDSTMPPHVKPQVNFNPRSP